MLYREKSGNPAENTEITLYNTYIKSAFLKSSFDLETGASLFLSWVYINRQTPIIKPWQKLILCYRNGSTWNQYYDL
jgi:hypothetical protein